MKLKICGLKYPENYNKLVKEVEPDYAGFIFHEHSERFAGELIQQSELLHHSENIKRVGVFVNSSIPHIVHTCKSLSVSVVQLHGEESSAFASEVKAQGFTVIKAFRIDALFDFSRLNFYRENVDYFLFDYNGASPGGNGKKFDWKKLNAYPLDVPYFLSGGISPDDVEKIKQLDDSRFAAVDINSRFEIIPGKKEIELVKSFTKQLKL
jgi:phosphoribosylanthranilate isomerase